MRTILLNLFLSTVSLALLGQGKPRWTQESERELDYPSRFFFTGYAQGNARAGETVEDAKNRLMRDAQGLLSESVRVTVRSHASSQTVSAMTNRTERIDAVFSSNVQTFADVEIVGIRSEPPYHDPATGVVHAFAYVSRNELAGFHKSNIAMNLAQAEGLLQTALNLEAAGEKPQARRQCEQAMPLLAKIRASQNMLAAVDPHAAPDDLQTARTEALHGRMALLQAHLAQSVIVFLESVESNFSRAETVLGNRLKALLSERGCSFADEPAQADFRLKIEASTRYYGAEYDFTVCYADVTVSLFDVRKDRIVFQDEFSQKGVLRTRETAGRQALEDAAPTIAEKISEWIY